jgi:hypothetical protein
MATINWSITGSLSDISSDVIGTFEVTTTTNAVNVEIPTSITISSPKPGTSSFVPINVRLYDDGIGNGQYVTWRNTNPDPEQFPSSGVSFDIWSPALASLISSGANWDSVISAGSFSLEPLKWTVFYTYDFPDATWYGKDGTITFSI